MTDNNLIDFPKYINESQVGIDSMAARQYFVEQVLPYVGDAALQRLLKAEATGDAKAVKLEMARLFVETEIMHPGKESSSLLSQFFLLNKLNGTIPK